MGKSIKSKKLKIICIIIFLIIIIMWILLPKIVKDIDQIESIKLSVLVDSLNSGYDIITITERNDIKEICNKINKSLILGINITTTDALQKDYDYSLLVDYAGFKSNKVIYIEKDGTILTYLYGDNEGYIYALNSQIVDFLDNYINNNL